MKLTDKAIEKINTRTRNRLALEMGCSAGTVNRWISENAENGDLTKLKAIQIISEETGLPIEKIAKEVKTSTAA